MQGRANTNAAVANSLAAVEIDDSEQRHIVAKCLTEKYVTSQQAETTNLRVALAKSAEQDRELALRIRTEECLKYGQLL